MHAGFLTSGLGSLTSFRRSLVFGGQTVLTAGVSALDNDAKSALLRLVQTFEAFTPDNDPHGEHDFGAIDHAGVSYFWKIDYYDQGREFASPDAADQCAVPG